MLSLVKRIWLLFLIFTFSLVLLQARNRFLERASSQVSAAVPAFPGAEGFGSQTIGGRGGKVIEVTNLNDSGTGSLRACIDAIDPRICIFRVAGTITLNSDIDIVNPYLTIAGQTAPGGGITLKAANSASTVHIRVRAPEIIIRYIRSRPGTKETNSRALSINNTNNTVYNVVIDHNSFSWSGDELTITWLATNRVSYQWNIASESLPPGFKGPSFGEDGGGYFSVHHNLIAHHTQRLPQVSASVGPVDMVNNLIYNPGGLGSVVKNGTHANYVKNYIKRGPNTASNFVYIKDGGVKGPAAGYYVEGNFLDGIQKLNTAVNQVNTRFNAPPITTTSPQVAYEEVLNKVGAYQGLDCNGNWFIRRDAVDIRVIQSVRDGTRGHNGSGYISSPADVGGWPTLAAGTPCADDYHDGMPNVWEQQRGLNLNQNDSAGYALDSNYTNIEMYINGPTTNVPPPTGSVIPTLTQTPTPTTSQIIVKLRFKILLPNIFLTVTNIPSSDVKIELRDGTSSVAVANADLVRNGNYFQTASEASFNISQSKAYSVFVKSKISLGRLFNNLMLTQSQTLDCTVVSNTACGELISQRDNKPLLSGDSDGFTVNSGSYNKVDSADLYVLATHFNQPATGQASFADFNLDGAEDISDLEILGKNYGIVGD